MLTATYSLIAISNEQNTIRRILRKAQQSILCAFKSVQQFDLVAVKNAFEQLMHFDALCHARKVERHLIPAIKAATRAADKLLGELENLSLAGRELLRSAGEVLNHRFPDRQQMMAAHSSLDMYCSKMITRLDREDDELFPLAEKVLSTEEWFAVAEKFLSEDKRALKRQHGATHFVTAPFGSSRLGVH